MTEMKSRLKTERSQKLTAEAQRLYEAEALTLQSMRLIAALNLEDDLSDEELVEMSKESTFSSTMIQHLIEYIKTI